MARDITDRIRDDVHDLLETMGRDVTLITREITARDDRYRDPEYTTSETQTVAEVVVRGTPRFEQRATGYSTEVSAVAWIPDTHDVYDGTTHDDMAASQLRVDATDELYTVHNLTDELNGKYRLALADQS